MDDLTHAATLIDSALDALTKAAIRHPALSSPSGPRT